MQLGKNANLSLKRKLNLEKNACLFDKLLIKFLRLGKKYRKYFKRKMVHLSNRNKRIMKISFTLNRNSFLWFVYKKKNAVIKEKINYYKNLFKNSFHFTHRKQFKSAVHKHKVHLQNI